MNVAGIFLLFFMLSCGLALVFLKPFYYAFILGSLLLAMSLTATVYLASIEGRYSRNAPLIKNGTPRSSVVEKLGHPTYITDCTFSPVHNETTTPPANCHVDYWYKSFFFPGIWQFSFDKQNHLIVKYHWVSY